MIEKIRDFLGLREPVPLALDVACGTGQSTLALKEVASQVVGTDTSREMLDRAPREPGVQYVEASAEDLPFADGSFRLVTVALALHWFERSRFLTEASRVLNPGGWLIIYDNGFFGEMRKTRSTSGVTGKITSHATPVRLVIKSLSQRMSAESTDFDSSRGRGIPTRFRSPSRSSPATL